MDKTRMATRIFERKPETVNAQTQITVRCRERFIRTEGVEMGSRRK
jgi:hypothetical protein